jgi:DNA modification methylase
MKDEKIKIEYVPLSSLRSPEYNPRVWSKEAKEQLEASIRKFGLVDPLLVNSAPERYGVAVGGNFRMSIARKLKIETVPVVFINIPDLAQEKELCLRLNRNTGDWSLDLLAKFDVNLLKNIGFSGTELDEIFQLDLTPEVFDLEKELRKLDITKIEIKKGDTWAIGPHKIHCGDSTIEADMLALMGDDKADMCFTDPPYILDYLRGKQRHGKPTEGFGLKRDRKYLETDVLPENFTELWMANIAKIQKPDFSIIIYENPKNLRTIWNELEKHWKYRNTITWHLPNRTQGFSAKYKFFNKQDIALVGTKGDVTLNLEPEDDALFETEYENALFATSGKPYWEGYKRNRMMCPSDFIEFKAADEKSSGQGIIFGTKPLEILIPYIKVLTKRGDLIVEPFGGSGSTMAASQKMGRRCFLMEKSPVYAEVIRKRVEKLTGIKAIKIDATQ